MIRTDLAEELRTHAMASQAKQAKGELDGILYNERKEDFIRISTIEITDERGEEILGKPKGKYVTLAFPTAAHCPSRMFPRAATGPIRPCST